VATSVTGFSSFPVTTLAVPPSDIISLGVLSVSIYATVPPLAGAWRKDLRWHRRDGSLSQMFSGREIVQAFLRFRIKDLASDTDRAAIQAHTTLPPRCSSCLQCALAAIRFRTSRLIRTGTGAGNLPSRDYHATLKAGHLAPDFALPTPRPKVSLSELLRSRWCLSSSRRFLAPFAAINCPLYHDCVCRNSAEFDAKSSHLRVDGIWSTIAFCKTANCTRPLWAA